MRDPDEVWLQSPERRSLHQNILSVCSGIVCEFFVVNASNGFNRIRITNTLCSVKSSEKWLLIYSPECLTIIIPKRYIWFAETYGNVLLVLFYRKPNTDFSHWISRLETQIFYYPILNWMQFLCKYWSLYLIKHLIDFSVNVVSAESRLNNRWVLTALWLNHWTGYSRQRCATIQIFFAFTALHCALGVCIDYMHRIFW